MGAGDVTEQPIYNCAFRVTFPILDNDGDLVTGAAGLDSEYSEDGANFADCNQEATEIGVASGMYYLDFIYTEMVGETVAAIVKTSTSDAKTTPMVMYPRRLPIVRANTAAAGANGSITLDGAASADDDFYNGCYVRIASGNGVGQVRRISDYDGGTKVATVVPDWTANPNSSSTFEVLLDDTRVNSVAIRDEILDDAVRFTGNSVAAILADVTGLNGDVMVGTNSAALATKLEAYVQLLARGDAAIKGDKAAELAEINANEGSGVGDYDNETDSIEAIRDTAPIGSTMVGTDGAAVAGDKMDLVNDAVDDDTVETYAKFKATGFAEPGNAMALTGAAVEAIWDDIGAVRGTVSDVGATVTDFDTDLAEVSNQHYALCSIAFTDGVLAGQVRPILTYTGAAKNVLVSPAFTEAPGNGDAFIILPQFASITDANGYLRVDLINDALDSSSLAASATDEIRDGILDDATRFSGGNIDAAISSRSSHTAANVWAVGTRTLTSYGSLVADVATAVWAAGTRTLTSVGTLLADIWTYASRTLTGGGDATEAKQDTIIADIAAVPTVGEIDTELTSGHGSGAWTTGGTGTGANTVTLTFTDDNSAAMGSTVVSIVGTGVAAATNSSGVVVFNLDDGDYTVRTPDTSSHIGEDNALTVSGDTAESYEVEARSTPVPSSADTCMVYVWVIDQAGNATTEGTFEVMDIVSPTATSTTPKQRVIQSENPDYLDSNGYAELELLRGAVVKTKLSPEDDEPIAKTITVPDATSADWNDL